MFFEIKPNTKLGKRAQSIANYYRNLSNAKGRIQRNVNKEKCLYVTVSKNNLFGLIYVGELLKGKSVSLSIEYGKLDASVYTSATGMVDCTDEQAKRLLKKLFDVHFKHVPENVTLDTKLRIA